MVNLAFSPRLILGTPSSQPLITCPTPILVSNGLPEDKVRHECGSRGGEGSECSTAVARGVEFVPVGKGADVMHGHAVALLGVVLAIAGLRVRICHCDLL